MGDGSLQEKTNQPSSLPRVQLPRAARRETHPQCFRSATEPGITPPHHRTRVASDASSHFVERVTRIEQSQRSLAPVFQQIGASLRSGHSEVCLLNTIILLLHYLCTDQIRLANGFGFSGDISH